MLTTRCPHCSTVFRIRPEQLSVRGGRVRCGHCQQAFSALSHLEEMDGDSLPPPSFSRPAAPAPVARSAAPSAAPVRPSEPRASTPAPAQPFPRMADPRPEPQVGKLPESEAARPVAAFSATPALEARKQAQTPPGKPDEPAGGDDFSMDIRFDGASPTQVRAEAGEAIKLDFDFSDIGAPAEAPAAAKTGSYESKIARELGIPAYDPAQDLAMGQTVMLEEPIEIPGLPEPESEAESLFLERERQQQQPQSLVEDRRNSRSGFWMWSFGLLLLTVLALLQLSYLFRTDLTRWLPESRPLLEEACLMLDCDVPYPKLIDDGSKEGLISIGGNSFTPDSLQEGRFRLIASILNKAAFDQAWPHIEVTITDKFDIAIARRVFAPSEWLPVAYAPLKAFGANSEVTASLMLDLGKLPAAGYRLYVFYP